jgi:hypothetical protein
MIRRNLAHRLSRSEEQIMPAGEPKVIEIVFINPDGTQAPGRFTFKIPFYPQHRAWQRGATKRGTWKRT